MQNYIEISQDDGLLASLAMILNNDKTALSCSSGTAFPTANVQIGQLCFRTDENKLYQTKDAATWTEVGDLSKSFTQHKADLVSRKEVVNSGAQVEGLTVLRDDGLPRYANSTTGVTGTIAIRLPSRRTLTMLGMKICGFEYTTNKCRWELNVGGYTYSTGWTVTGASSPSNLPWGTTVRFAEDANYSYILLGTTTTVWSYPKVWLDEVSLSHLGQTGAMANSSQYEILLLTDESALTVQATTTVNTGVSATAVNDGVYASTAQTISGAKTFSGATKITNSTASTSATTGALVVTGGVGVGGAVNVGGNAAITGTLTATGAATLNGGVTSTTGVFGSTVDSTDSSTGAVKISGGLGVAKSIYLGGSLNAAMDGSFGGVLGVTGKITAGSVDVTGAVKIASTTNSVSKDTGALIIEGGIGIEGDIYASNVYAALKGNADTATKLATPRTLNGINFDGSGNVTIPVSVTTLATTGADLNSYTTPGFYTCPTNATAQTLLNCPTTLAFSLLVEKSAGCVQTLTEYVTGTTAKTYKRHNYSGVWGAWYEILTSNNPDATKLPLAGGTMTGNLTVGTGGTLINLGAASGKSIRTRGIQGITEDNSATSGLYLNIDGGTVYFGGSTYYIGDDGVVNAASAVFSGNVAGQRFVAKNPNNDAANVALDWLSDIPRLRIGGNGTGSAANFQIQGASDFVRMNLDVAGNVEFAGYVKTNNGIQSTNAVSFLNGGSAQKINTGGVLVSGSYGDASLVPTYGIYSKGGLLTGATTVSTTLTALGQGTTAPITTGHVNVGTTYGYVPMLSGSTQSNSGYRQNISIGSYRPQSTWTGGAVYIAIGGHDNYPTEAFLFEYGRTISNTSGAIALKGNADTATKLATARTINGVSFDGTANITVADSTKVPLSGGTMTGNLNANALGVNNTLATTGLGVSLYGGATAGLPGYGMAFAGTATFGTHGAVSNASDWATYFTMSGATTRGWIFKSGNSGTTGNVASISAAGTITGANIVSSGNVTAYSDKRIKKNIKKIPDALSKIEALKGVIFERKDTKEKQTGLIAQDVEAVLPEAVTRHAPSDEAKKFVKDDELLSVSYGSLAGLFVEAIKELNKKLEDQAKLIDKQSLLIENLLNKKVSHP